MGAALIQKKKETCSNSGWLCGVQMSSVSKASLKSDRCGAREEAGEGHEAFGCITMQTKSLLLVVSFIGQRIVASEALVRRVKADVKKK